MSRSACGIAERFPQALEASARRWGVSDGEGAGYARTIWVSTLFVEFFACLGYDDSCAAYHVNWSIDEVGRLLGTRRRLEAKDAH